MHDTTARLESVTGIGVDARPPEDPSRGLRGWLAGKYNRIHRAIAPRTSAPTQFGELREIRELAAVPSDIDEHLELIFTEAVLHRPKLIVELGVRSGMSTFVFERAARIIDAWLVSVDIEDCSNISSYPKWHFVQSDDVTFAREFPNFCRERDIAPEINMLFIDTSHYYEHTVQEIEAWFPLLAQRTKVILHDTNLEVIGPRKDGCFQLSWCNDRGVMRALEERFARRFNNSVKFVDRAGDWLIRHHPNCNGLTILDRIS